MIETLALLKEIQEYSKRKYGEHHFFTFCSLGTDAQTESFQTIERWTDGVFVIKGNSNPYEFSLYSVNKQSDPSNFKAIYNVTSNFEILNLYFDKEQAEKSISDMSQ